MKSRKEIISEALKYQYKEFDGEFLDTLAEKIDSEWHIIKKRSNEGVNNEWTMSGQLQSVIWSELGGGAESASVAHSVLRALLLRDAEERKS